MRTPFYSSPERLALLAAEAHSWVGTPFRQACSVKGPTGGVDCVGVNLACYVASGFSAPGAVVLPAYDLEHYEHSDVSQLEEWFRREYAAKRMQMVDREDGTRDGDTVFIKQARAVHHTGLIADGYLFFTMRGQGVMNLPINSLGHLKSEIRAIFRPVELDPLKAEVIA